MVVPCIVKSWLYRSGPTSVLSGRASCSPHPQGQDAAGEEEAERRDEKAARDRLVVDGAEPAEEAGRITPGVVQCTRHALAAVKAIFQAIGVTRGPGHEVGAAHRSVPR